MMNESGTGKRSRVPAWLAVLVLVLCLGGAAGLVWWRLTRQVDRTDAMVIDNAQRTDRQRPERRDPPPRPQQRQTPATQRARPAVVSDDSGLIRAVARSVELRVRLGDSDRAFFSLRPTAASDAGDEQRLVFAARRAIRDQELARTLQLSADQLARLRQLQSTRTVTVSKEDQARLETLADQWQKAPAAARPAAEANLVQTLEQIGSRAVAASRQAMRQTIQQTRAILTPQQIEQLKQVDLRAPAGRNPTTRPAGA